MAPRFNHQHAPLPPLGRVGAPWWDDKPLAIVGCGPSLKGFDFNRLNIPGVRVLAVNQAIWDLPFADVLFSLDRPHINDNAERWTPLPQEKFFAVEHEYGRVAEVPGATYLQRSRFDGYSDDPAVIQSGANSGFGATQLAYLKRGPARHPWPWVWFGYDYTARFGDHYCPERYPKHADGMNSRYWENWGDCFQGCQAQLLGKNIRIMNASPVSSVRAFPKCSVDEGVALLTQLAAI